MKVGCPPGANMVRARLKRLFNQIELVLKIDHRGQCTLWSTGGSAGVHDERCLFDWLRLQVRVLLIRRHTAGRNPPQRFKIAKCEGFGIRVAAKH